MKSSLSSPVWKKIWGHYPPVFCAAVEAVSSICGFPGFGWLFRGKALAGLIMVITGPIVAWVVIPAIIAVRKIYISTVLGPLPIIVYLLASCLISTATLYFFAKLTNRRT